MCNTIGGPWGMYITFTSAKKVNKAEPTLALNSRGHITRNPKKGHQWPLKRTCVHQKFFKKVVDLMSTHLVTMANVTTH